MTGRASAWQALHNTPAQNIMHTRQCARQARQCSHGLSALLMCLFSDFMQTVQIGTVKAARAVRHYAPCDCAALPSQMIWAVLAWHEQCMPKRHHTSDARAPVVKCHSLAVAAGLSKVCCQGPGTSCRVKHLQQHTRASTHSKQRPARQGKAHDHSLCGGR